MEFISWLLAIIGLGSDNAKHISNQRAEVGRLNAEVAGEVGRALDIIASAMPRLTRLSSQMETDPPDICAKVIALLDEQRSMAEQILKMTSEYKILIAKKDNHVDWDQALLQFYEWRATSSRIVPYVQNIISKIDGALDDSGLV